MNILIALLLSCSIFAKDPAMVWGKIVKVDKTVKNVSYKYFVTYEVNGKFHAYPLETKNKNIAEQIAKNENQLIRIKGDIKTVKVAIDGPAQDIPVFIPESLSPLTLSELAVEFKPDLEKKPADVNPPKEAYNGGGIRVNDTLANTLIITGGALMVGSALIKSLNKK
ncbi:hypothetical protein [Peredibacter starrii]|uniref:Uncharacterized protein n=1 Tax=Peredibacter starrii TaxID=28202 RepID=A0AAX4HPF6_9BACT|nr:hypothetical protein [Peredibacter starrii]WPU65215.1 hypothetical protein SOO65_00445 [Peredibacter starrii]